MSDQTEDISPERQGWMADPTAPGFLPDLVEAAWGIIANAGCAQSPMGWHNETAEWQQAAAAWRGRYHAWLDARKDSEFFMADGGS